MIKNIESLEEFIQLTPELQSQCLMAYANKYKIMGQSKKYYSKKYKGVVFLNDEDYLSQLYYSMAMTLSRITEKILYVKSPKTKKEIKLTFKSFEKREKWIKRLRKKRFLVLKEENILIVKRKLTKEETKEINKVKKKKGYKGHIKRKKLEIKAYKTRYRASVKRRLKKLGFDVSEFGVFFKSFSHLTFYFRKNFISYIQKEYNYRVAKKRNPEGDFVPLSKVNVKPDDSEMGEIRFNHYNSLNQEEIEKSQFLNYSLFNQSVKFLQQIEDELIKESEKNTKYNIMKVFHELYYGDKKTILETSRDLNMTKSLFNRVKKDIVLLLQIFWLKEDNPELLISKIGIDELYRLGKTYLNSVVFNDLKIDIEQELDLRIFDSRDPRLGQVIIPKANIQLPEFIKLNKEYQVVNEFIPDKLTEKKSYVIIGDDNQEHLVCSELFDNNQVIGEVYEG